MPNKAKWIIPDDYNELETEWVTVMMCVPNTRGWRGVVSGAIYNLTRGRYWDENTGIITVAQVIGERIHKSLRMDCENNWLRIADSLESLDAKFPSPVTLQEFMDSLGDAETIEAISEWLGLGAALANIIPHLHLQLTPVDWVKWFFEMRWRGQVAGSADGIEKWLRTLAMVETGETGAEVAEAVDSWLDNLSDWASLILQGGSMFSEAASAFALLQGWFTADESNNDNTLRNLNRVYNSVFIEGDAMANEQTQTVNISCGCGGSGCGGCDGSGTGFVADQSPNGSTIDDPAISPLNGYGPSYWPSGFDSFSDWQDYKCKAANAMVLNLTESLFQLYDISNSDHPQQTHSIVVNSIERYLISLDFMFGTGWLYSVPFYTAFVNWEAEQLADYVYNVPDMTPFEIFYDLRNELITERETYVCGIYNSGDSGEVEQSLLDNVTTWIAGSGYSTEIQAWATSVFQDMLSSYWLNIPFKHYDNIAGFEDAGAIDCQAVCSDYQYPTGVCTVSDASCTNPEDGQGPADGIWTESIDTDGWWRVDFTTPLVINTGMTIEANVDLVGGQYANWQFKAIIDGTQYTIRDLATINIDGWYGNNLNSYVGQDLEGFMVVVGDPGPGQDPNFAVDGVRVGGVV